MKLFSLILLLGTFLASHLHAQVGGVTVELTLDQEQYLSNEDLRVAVRITNRSGQTLAFGQDNSWLTFSVEARERYLVRQLDQVPVEGEFTLESSQMGTKRVNLTPYFDFRQTGRYQVIASVRIPQWDKEIVSRPATFDVINGTKLREIDFGVPTTATNSQPEMRKYILQQANYMKQMRLYLRLTDSTGSGVLRVFPVAPMVSFSKPEAQLDRVSNLHVLNQTGARSFSYSVINPDGDFVIQQTYDYSSTRPVLQFDDEGKISVSGGVRRVSPRDLPQPTAPAQLPAKDAQITTP